MRYLPLSKTDREDMLQSIGVSSVDDLYASIPAEIQLDKSLGLDNHKSEIEVERYLQKLAAKNLPANQTAFFLGAGCYNHHIPAAVDAIIQRSEFLTSYTPYQPEISQGTLKAIFQYQSMICALTGMEVANASMYDGATSLAEATSMARRITKKNNITIVGEVNPDYLRVLESYMEDSDGKINYTEIQEDTACLIVQTPDYHGIPQELADLRKKCDEHGCLLIVAITEIISLGLLPPPKEADIVVGEAQSIGVGMNFGGPHLGFFSCKMKNVRQMPGRVCGESVDLDGKVAYALTLSAREQHIRREKATSNICSNQGLCMLAFTVHLALLGEQGFKKLAAVNHQKACNLADRLSAIAGVTLLNKAFFNEFVIEVNKDVGLVLHDLLKQNIMAGVQIADNKLLIAATEMVTDEDIDQFANALENLVR
jgi:glycine dehydrogenase subunit 1